MCERLTFWSPLQHFVKPRYLTKIYICREVNTKTIKISSVAEAGLNFCLFTLDLDLCILLRFSSDSPHSMGLHSEGISIVFLLNSFHPGCHFWQVLGSNLRPPKQKIAALTTDPLRITSVHCLKVELKWAAAGESPPLLCTRQRLFSPFHLWENFPSGLFVRKVLESWVRYKDHQKLNRV